MTEAEQIAAKLTKAQRETEWWGIGHKRLPKAVAQLWEAGLVTSTAATMGWAWKPTDMGKAVREVLK